MATWNTDNPKMTNNISGDIPDIEENFEELHDVVEQITDGTLGTTEPGNFQVDRVGMGGNELKLDSDGHESITADTDDQIDIKCANADQICIKDGSIEPSTDNDVDLGASDKEFKDAYLQGSFVHNGATKTIEVSSPSAAASVSLTVSAGSAYRITFMLSSSTGSLLYVRLNSDTGSNYSWSLHEAGIESTAQHAVTSSSSDTEVGINISGFDYYMGEILFHTLPGDNTIGMIRSDLASKDTAGAGYLLTTNAVGYYDGSSAITSLQIVPSGGTLTGKVICERLN